MLENRKISNNPFITLLNRRLREDNGAIYAERFIDTYNEKQRLEYFLSVRGISFIDDTKAQSVNAIWYSLESISSQVTLIVKDLEYVEDLLAIKQLLMMKVKSIVFLTEREEYLKILQPIVGVIHFAKTMEEAVIWAYENTESNDTVLFSSGIKVDIEKESVNFRNAVRGL